MGLGPVSAPAHPIFIDGFFDDWATVPVVARDAGDAPGTPIDFGEVRATGDGDALFLMIETGPEVNLRAVDGTLSVHLDVDGDPSSSRTMDVTSPGGAGVSVSPSVASSRFEIRIERGPWKRVGVKLVFATAGRVRDETPAFVLDLPPATPKQTLSVIDRIPWENALLRASHTALRVVSWEIGDAASRNESAFARVIAALDADVLLLGETGARPVVRTRIPNRIALETSNSSPATGVIVTLGDRRLLFGAFDVSCCGSADDGPGAPDEAHRVAEADAIRAAVARTMRDAGVAGVVLGGNLNLVGTRAPLDVLRRDLDADGSALEPVYALDIAGTSADTWRDPVGRWPPARLDWLLYSDSTIEIVDAFVFDTARFTPYWLDYHSVRAADALAVSRHLPIVADLRWRPRGTAER
jgi:hypothetical protein